MKIEYEDVPKLLTIFKSYWSKKYHIRFAWGPIQARSEDTKAIVHIDVINVKINDTILGGQGEENWTLEYAYTILKNSKERELCVKRWKDGFKNAKKVPTLDIGQGGTTTH